MDELIDNRNVNTKIFGSGISFYKLVWCFVVASMFGTYYEEILTYFKFGVWENRSSVIIGPFNPLYGTAFVLAIVLLWKMKNPLKIILLGTIFGGVFEYLASWAQEFFTGSNSWNYNGLFLNINGRTTVIYALFWGLLVYIFVKIVYPPLSDFIEKLPYKFAVIFTNIFIVFITLNMIITYTMLIRQGLRLKGIEPYTFIGEYYDEIFTDEYIEELFPNMILKEVDDNE